MAVIIAGLTAYQSAEPGGQRHVEQAPEIVSEYAHNDRQSNNEPGMLKLDAPSDGGACGALILQCRSR